jgi:murein DD-endopeptidase MepM/ murein hydrolase activator NlpD
MLRLAWPLRGVVYARFGKRGNEVHDGIDLAAPAGTPVRTAAHGRVLFAAEQRGYGLLLIIEHEAGLVTLYAHNEALKVKEGQKVEDGEVVATVGESGHTTGPHLHFEVRVNGIPVDPMLYLGPPPRASRSRALEDRAQVHRPPTKRGRVDGG